MSVNAEIFNVVEIKAEVKKFNSFSLREYLFIGKDGQSLRVHVYHNDSDALLLHPTIERTIE